MKFRTLLAVDVGNSRTKFGLFRFERSPEPRGTLPQLVASTAVRNGNSLPWNELQKWIGASAAGVRAIIAGVNPGGVRRVRNEWGLAGVPAIVEDFRQLGLPVNVDAPEKVGIDRLLNAVAANHCRDENQPALIVDTGTATTVDRVSPDGSFEGGAILPGIELAGAALHHYTALLPQVCAEEIAAGGKAPAPLGKNTRDAIRSGLFYSQVGALRELLLRLVLPAERPLILLTGGAAPLLVADLQDEGELRCEEHLPLKGLALAGRSLFAET